MEREITREKDGYANIELVALQIEVLFDALDARIRQSVAIEIAGDLISSDRDCGGGAVRTMSGHLLQHNHRNHDGHQGPVNSAN